MDCDQLVLQITRMKNLQKEIEEKTPKLLRRKGTQAHFIFSSTSRI